VGQNQSVRLSVFLSVFHNLVLNRNCCTNRDGLFGRQDSLNLCYIESQVIQVLQNLGYFHLELPASSALRKITLAKARRHRKCHQQSIDGRRLVITLGVQLCVPCDGRGAACRAAASAPAEVRK